MPPAAADLRRPRWGHPEVAGVLAGGSGLVEWGNRVHTTPEERSHGLSFVVTARAPARATDTLRFGSRFHPLEVTVGVLEFILILAIGAPLAKALATRISGRQLANSRAVRQALEQTEQRLEDTEHRLADTLDRLTDVEERLDFAERLLARQQSREQLNP